MNMTIDEIIEQVTEICKKHNVEHLSLFGSYATGTATATSDVDFVVYGVDDILDLQEDIDENVLTLKTIDLFEYDEIQNEYLLKDIRDYAKQIY